MSTFAPSFTITNSISRTLSGIDQAKGFLDAATLSRSWLDQMRRRAIVLEAHHTTHIEGTHLTLEQSEKLLAGEKLQNIDPEDERELRNYIRAFDYVEQHIEDNTSITEEMILEIHRRLVLGVRGGNASPGKYRLIQNYIINSLTGEIVYTPPPPESVPGMTRDLIEWLNSGIDIHPVLISGVAQFQLVHIHPFSDGNGRTSRLLSTACLYRAGYDFKKLFTISQFYDRNRKEFYRALQNVRERDMDLTGWLEYFTSGLSVQMIEVTDRGRIAIRKELISKKHNLSNRQDLLVAFLLEHSKMNVQDAEVICPGVNRRTLQRDLAELINMSIVIKEGSTNQLVYRLDE
jgi:Fic family protein